jgi:glycosyltransferase involved in cell wall biosynthesis
MSRANLGLPPPVIEASGYDLAIVDTPHFIKVQGIAPDRILAVVHDLIPLRDPTMDANWRNLFMRKLDATLALGSNLVFVSRCTQRAFHASFPRHAALREFILYPAIRRSLMRNAELPPAERGAQSSVDPFEIDPPRIEDSPVKSKKKNKNRLRIGAPIPAAFDRALPYFITATSDEPRKNIGAVVTAFRQFLRGRANVVVLGEIDARRYDSNASANVYFPGYVSDAQKAAFFRNAHGALFASLSEGFGIPIVEGAVMGLPVICSDIEVFREVAGDHAFYFDPHSPASLASAVEDALADPATARARAAALKEWSLARFSQAAVGAHVRVALGEIGLRL